VTFAWKSPDEGVIDARKEVAGRLLVIRAQDVKRTSYGLQAKVTIALASSANATSAQMITSDVLNLDKEDARHGLSNVLYGTGTTRGKQPKLDAALVTDYPRADFERDLLDFSQDFHRELLGNLKGGFVKGDASKTTPSFLLDGYVLSEGGTILYAPPKSAKSYTAMLWAVAIDAGVPRFGSVTPTRVLYINLERGANSMARRLGLVNRVLGLDPDRELLMLNRRGRTLKDVYEPAKEMIAEHKVGLVILDSLSRGGTGDLNSNEDANSSMDYLNRLHPAWIAIGHTPRADDTHIFGSNMFDAAMDIGVNVRRQRLPDGTLGIGLHVKDTNDTGVPPLRIHAYEFDQYGLVNVRDAYEGEFPEIEDGSATSTPRTNRDRILDVLRYGARTQAEIVEALDINKGTVSSEIKALISLGKAQLMPHKKGNSTLYGLPYTEQLGVNQFQPVGATGSPPFRGEPNLNHLNQTEDSEDWA
jgi:hypothetical protein